MKTDVSRDFQSEEQELTYKKGGNNMKTKMKNLIKNQKGMTLIELLAVIVIIAIIALIAIPAIGNIIDNSHDKAILSDASNIISGAKIGFTDDSCTNETQCTGADLEKYVKKTDVDLTEVIVTKSGSDYSIYYDELGNMKGKYKDKVGKNLTDAQLSNLMKKGPESSKVGNDTKPTIIGTTPTTP